MNRIKYINDRLDVSDVDREEHFNVDGIDYLLTEKVKTMLRNSIIDWGTFLEVYGEDVEFTILYKQITRILDINESDNLAEILLPILKKLYKLPADAHMRCMIKQYQVYEPMAIAVKSLFTIMKEHFEHLVKTFIIERNNFIIKQGLRKAKTNDLDELLIKWKRYNVDYNLDSSSVILLFLNPNDGLKSHIHYSVNHKDDNINKAIIKLKSAVDNFKYPGFCPKVSIERFILLMKFPINEFCEVISMFKGSKSITNYNKINELIANIIKDKPEKPHIKDTFTRDTPPNELLISYKNDHSNPTKNVNVCKLIKWYVSKILELRENLVDEGKKYELYYTVIAKNINDING